MSQSFCTRRSIDPSLGALLAAAGEDMTGYVALIEPCAQCMGDMDEFRLTFGKAWYTASFTPPSVPFT